MNDPIVGVIMPAYNAETFISASIESVIAQTYTNWELTIVDDGSTDGTVDIVRKYAAVDCRVKYFYQQNGRQAKARNTGLKHSDSPLVAFLDADDLWVKEKLELQVRTLLDSNCDLVYSDGFVFSDNNTTDESLNFTTRPGKFSGSEWFAALSQLNVIPVLSVMVRRDVLDKVGGFDENPRYHGVEDYDLWLTIARHGFVFYGMKEKLVRYRLHQGGTSRDEELIWKSTVAVLEKHSDGSKPFRSRIRNIRKQLAMRFLDNYFSAARSGLLQQAMPFLWKSIRQDPRLFWHFRRFGAVFKNAAIGLMGGPNK
jgi:glycosyltransferase involved in cell wall biosynthesis